MELIAPPGVPNAEEEGLEAGSLSSPGVCSLAMSAWAFFAFAETLGYTAEYRTRGELCPLGMLLALPLLLPDIASRSSGEIAWNGRRGGENLPLTSGVDGTLESPSSSSASSRLTGEFEVISDKRLPLDFSAARLFLVTALPSTIYLR